MNKVILMGRLTRDPEVRYTTNTNTLVGRLQTRNWEDENKVKHYITEVVAEEAYFADSKRDNAGADGFENTFGSTVSESSEFSVQSDDDLPF